jgi:hypothetical protein
MLVSPRLVVRPDANGSGAMDDDKRTTNILREGDSVVIKDTRHNQGTLLHESRKNCGHRGQKKKKKKKKKKNKKKKKWNDQTHQPPATLSQRTTHRYDQY